MEWFHWVSLGLGVAGVALLVGSLVYELYIRPPSISLSKGFTYCFGSSFLLVFSSLALLSLGYALKFASKVSNKLWYQLTTWELFNLLASIGLALLSFVLLLLGIAFCLASFEWWVTRHG